jgi:hypothetical protein
MSAWSTERGSDAERLQRSRKVEQRGALVGGDDDAARHDLGDVGGFPGIPVIVDGLAMSEIVANTNFSER